MIVEGRDDPLDHVAARVELLREHEVEAEPAHVGVPRILPAFRSLRDVDGPRTGPGEVLHLLEHGPGAPFVAELEIGQARHPVTREAEAARLLCQLVDLRFVRALEQRCDVGLVGHEVQVVLVVLCGGIEIGEEPVKVHPGHPVAASLRQRVDVRDAQGDVVPGPALVGPEGEPAVGELAGGDIRELLLHRCLDVHHLGVDAEGPDVRPEGHERQEARRALLQASVGVTKEPGEGPTERGYAGRIDRDAQRPLALGRSRRNDDAFLGEVRRPILVAVQRLVQEFADRALLRLGGHDLSDRGHGLEK